MQPSRLTALLLLCAAPLLAEGPTTATAPSTTPATAAAMPTSPDFSTPNAAAVSFILAIRTGDSKTIFAAMAGAEKDRALLTPLIELTAARARLQSVMVKQFGAEELTRAKLMDLIASPALAQDAWQAPAHITGDKATLTLNPLGGEIPAEVSLIKIDAAWKIDAATYLGDENARKTIQQYQPVITASIAAVEKTVEEIAAKKYPTPASAQRALQERLLTAVQSAESKP